MQCVDLCLASKNPFNHCDRWGWGWGGLLEAWVDIEGLGLAGVYQTQSPASAQTLAMDTHSLLMYMYVCLLLRYGDRGQSDYEGSRRSTASRTRTRVVDKTTVDECEAQCE